jgi:hypothetical protein
MNDADVLVMTQSGVKCESVWELMRMMRLRSEEDVIDECDGLLILYI